MPTVLVTESGGFSPAVSGRLREVATLRLMDGMTRAQLLDAVRDVEVLWVRLGHRIDAEVMQAAPGLRAIVSATTGTDHIDLHEAESRGIQVFSLYGQAHQLGDVRSTAEHTVALILMLMRRIPDALDHVRAGGWDRNLFWGEELFGKAVGVVGYGRLGRLVAGYMQAFDSEVLASDPCVADEIIESDGVRPCGLEELLQTADIVTLHAPLRPATFRMLGKAELDLMPRSAWLVNTARGALVDEDALLAALTEDALAGAALDVLADEWGSGSSGLREYARAHGNLLITPHIGGATVEAREKTEMLVGEQLVQFLAGKTR